MLQRQALGNCAAHAVPDEDRRVDRERIHQREDIGRVVGDALVPGAGTRAVPG